jgi:drug/metabolite transporter (DMT)-like permease
VSSSAPPSRWQIGLALASVYVFWGSTYLAIRVALESFPPLLMGAVRFLMAGAVVFAWQVWRGAALPTKAQWKNIAVLGFVLLAIGNGFVCMAEEHVSSGLAAVGVASMPLWAAVFGRLMGQRSRAAEWAGLLLGFSGVVLLNFDAELTGSPLGALLLIIAPISWAFGSAWSRGRDLPAPLMNTAAQMLVGGSYLLIGGLLMGERIVDWPTLKAGIAVAHLAVFGSIFGFGAYVWLLTHVRPALATSYAYVNPPIAVLLGVLLLNEQIGHFALIGMTIILSGVVLITRSRA